MFVDAQPRRLAVGEQADAVEACVPHAFDNLIGRARQHMPPVAGELDGRGKKRRGLFDGWGKNFCHHGERSALGSLGDDAGSNEPYACRSDNCSDERAATHRRNARGIASSMGAESSIGVGSIGGESCAISARGLLRGPAVLMPRALRVATAEPAITLIETSKQ